MIYNFIGEDVGLTESKWVVVKECKMRGLFHKASQSRSSDLGSGLPFPCHLVHYDQHVLVGPRAALLF